MNENTIDRSRREHTLRNALVGPSLRLARERRGWTIEQLALRTAVDPDLIASIESGQTLNPDQELMLRILDIFRGEPAPGDPQRLRETRFPTRLGVLLQQERRRRGWSLDELAGRSQVDKGTLSRLENGVLRTTSEQNLARLAEALELKVAATVLKELSEHPAQALTEEAASIIDVSDDPAWLPASHREHQVDAKETDSHSSPNQAASLLGAVALRHPSVRMRCVAVGQLSELCEKYVEVHTDVSAILNVVSLTDPAAEVVQSARHALKHSKRLGTD